MDPRLAGDSAVIEKFGADGAPTQRRALKDVLLVYKAHAHRIDILFGKDDVLHLACAGVKLRVNNGSLAIQAPGLQIITRGVCGTRAQIFVQCVRDRRVTTEKELKQAKQVKKQQLDEASVASLLAGRVLNTDKKPLRSEVLTPAANGSGAGASGSAAADGKPVPIALSAEQEAIVTAVLSGLSIFFTGSAGTGKTVVLHELRRRVPGVALTASTAISACAVGAVTLHSWAGVSAATLTAVEDGELAVSRAVAEVRRHPDALSRWKLTRTLIIEEVSIISAETFDALDAIARGVRGIDKPWGGLQLVCAGDFAQLPPVSSAGKPRRMAFHAAAWATTLHGCMQLRTVFRQADQEFVSILNELRFGRVSDGAVDVLRRRWASNATDEGGTGILPTKLTTHRSEVDVENAAQLATLAGEPAVFPSDDWVSATHPGAACLLDSACPAPKSLQLKEGAQVILVKTIDAGAGMVNGARGVVLRFQGAARLPVVRLVSGAEVVIRQESWEVRTGPNVVATRRQLPLDLAWSLSIHKSQGMTLDAVEVNLSRVFEFGQAYVALSRARSLAGLVLTHRFEPTCVKAHPDVVAFYTALEAGERMPKVAPSTGLGSSSSSGGAGSGSGVSLSAAVAFAAQLQRAASAPATSSATTTTATAAAAAAATSSSSLSLLPSSRPTSQPSSRRTSVSSYGSNTNSNTNTNASIASSSIGRGSSMVLPSALKEQLNAAAASAAREASREAPRAMGPMGPPPLLSLQSVASAASASSSTASLASTQPSTPSFPLPAAAPAACPIVPPAVSATTAREVSLAASTQPLQPLQPQAQPQPQPRSMAAFFAGAKKQAAAASAAALAPATSAPARATAATAAATAAAVAVMCSPTKPKVSPLLAAGTRRPRNEAWSPKQQPPGALVAAAAAAAAGPGSPPLRSPPAKRAVKGTPRQAVRGSENADPQAAAREAAFAEAASDLLKQLDAAAATAGL